MTEQEVLREIALIVDQNTYDDKDVDENYENLVHELKEFISKHKKNTDA